MSFSTEAVSLLCRLVDDGPQHDAISSPHLPELEAAGLAELVCGKRGRAVVRATFAGKARRIEWRDTARLLLTR